MFRIDNDTSTGSLPTPAAVGPNPDSFFTEGDPGIAVPATVVTADWLNAIQEEIAYVIETAGDTLDKTDQSQLYAAINTLIAAAVSGSDLLPPGHVSGLILSNNVSDATNDIDISVGKAKSSSADFDITVASAIGKRIDAVWATAGTPGTTTGGRASAVALAAGWYRVFLIAKTDGTVNAGFDTSATATNLLADATGYTKYRQIGWVYYTGSTIKAFDQIGNRFVWDVPAVDVWQATPTSTATLHTVTAPPDENSIGEFQLKVSLNGGAATDYFGLYTATRQTNTAASATAWTITAFGTSDSEQFDSQASIPMDTSSQIRSRFDSATATAGNYQSITTTGWTDTSRG